MNSKFTITNLKYIFYFITAALIFSGCADNGNNPQPPHSHLVSVYVINEGNFSDHNGSLTSYNPQTKTAEQQAFEKANDRPLAGYIQSSTVISDSLYIVSNSTDKIEVVDLHTLSSVGTIKYSKTPTSIVPAGDGKAYVANLYDNSVSVVNLKTRKQTDKTISVGTNPYFAYQADGKVFVSNNGFGDDNTISVIDVKSGTVGKH